MSENIENVTKMNLKQLVDKAKTVGDYVDVEPICDMATVKVDRTHNVRISVNPDINRKGDEYFKFYNSFTSKKDEKVARILFRRSDYVFHNGGKDAWVLNSSEKKLLMDLLTSTVTSMTGRKVTLFQYAILQYNRERFGMEEEDTFSNDFTEFSEALPINLVMPDYTML